MYLMNLIYIAMFLLMLLFLHLIMFGHFHYMLSSLLLVLYMLVLS